MKASTIVIVGASFGGLKIAWDLRHALSEKHRILLFSDKPQTTIRASFPEVVFENKPLEDSAINLEHNFNGSGITFVHDQLVKIDQEADEIITKNSRYRYDFLILATGVRHTYELLPGSQKFAQPICDPEYILKTKEAVREFHGGEVYAGVGAGFTPCDGPPLEMLMCLDYQLRRQGVRDKSRLHYITDKEHVLPPAGPKIWPYLESLLRKRDIEVHLNTYLKQLDEEKLHFEDGTTKPFDLCLLIPPYRGVEALQDSGLVDERGFVPVILQTMRAEKAKHYNIYAVGDCAAIPGPKQGHLALMQATIAAEHISWRINQKGKVRAYLPEFKCVMFLGGQQGLYLYSQWMSDGAVVEVQEGYEPHLSKNKFEELFIKQKGDIGELHHQIMK